jgi:hypothetical protein
MPLGHDSPAATSCLPVYLQVAEVMLVVYLHRLGLGGPNSKHSVCTTVTRVDQSAWSTVGSACCTDRETALTKLTSSYKCNESTLMGLPLREL